MIEISTEEKILKAARQVFIEKGFEGTRMQEIADIANLNKSMLHYYYRTKHKLFLQVFEESFKKFIPKVGQIMLSDNDFMSKIKFFISTYIDLLLENPFLPLFIMKEITRKPEIIQNIISIKFSEILESLNLFIDEEVEKGIIRKVNINHLIMNIVSLCIFPFIAQPMMMTIFEVQNDEYRSMMLERKEVVFNLISLWLKP